MKRRKLQFKNKAEEAKFWYTHSTTDYVEKSKKIKVVFKEPLSGNLSLRIDKKDLTHLRKIAAKKGIGPTTLVRIWVKENLNREKI